MTRPIDPWASTDHDPTSQTQNEPEGEIFTTAQTLEFARQDIHGAVDAHDDPHWRRHYAHAALSYANTVLMAKDATADQRDRLLPTRRHGDARQHCQLDRTASDRGPAHTARLRRAWHPPQKGPQL